MLTPAFYPWSDGHQCTAVQTVLLYDWLKSGGKEGLAPWEVSTPWVLTNDSCIHPSIAGYQQFAASLMNWLDTQGPGQSPTSPAPARPLLQVSYRSVQIGTGPARVRLAVTGRSCRRRL